ncbi:MAG: 7TM diverse intracellular signaling domain-containing protein [Bacteroidota bacterium]
MPLTFTYNVLNEFSKIAKVMVCIPAIVLHFALSLAFLAVKMIMSQSRIHWDVIRVVTSILFFSILCLADALGSSSIVIDELKRKIYVSEMDQYIDVNSTLTFEDFSHSPGLFQKSKKILQGTRNKKYTYWMAFKLKGELLTQESFYLLCTDSRISQMQMWIDGEVQTENAIGTNCQFDDRNVNHRYLVHKMPQRDELEIVIKIRSNQSTFFAFELKSENHFLRDSYWVMGMFGGAYGVIVMGLFFSLFMRLRFKEGIYTAFITFALVSFLTCLFLDGNGFQYFWYNMPSMNLILLIVLPSAVLFSSAFLVLSFLDAWDRNNHYFKIIMISLLLALVGYTFAIIIPEYFIHSFFYLIPFAAMISVCIDRYRAGHPSMLPFIIGFVFVLLANLLFILQPFFPVEYFHSLIRFSPHFGVVALTVALSYSQYKKFFYITESRNNERKKSMERMEQLSMIKDQVNKEIAEKVKQQTKELAQKNSIIHQQNAELQKANDKLKSQTDEIIILNLKLDQENQELKSDVEKITESRILQNTIPFDDFKKYFHSDDACYALLEELKWQNGFKCVKCGNEKYGRGKGERARRCTKCGTNESVTSNTIFHRIHFPILKGFYMLFLVNKHGDNLISKDLSEIVDLRLATCWKFSKKIKSRKAELEQSGKVIESWLNLI